MKIVWHWHSICLAVYLIITMCDFVFFPIWTEYYNNALNPASLVELSLKYQGAVQIAVLQDLNKERVWQPLTLEENGMFHVAFGAVLGIGAWKRTRQDGAMAPKKPNVEPAV